MTELPICAAILAQETGLPECKSVSLVERMRRAGMTVYHARTHLVFREYCPQGLISAILGHSGGGVTRLYIHNDAEMMREFLNRVCEAVYAAKEEAV